MDTGPGYLPPFLLGSPGVKTHVPFQKCSQSQQTLTDKSFCVRFNSMDKENASDYGKSSLRGPPVQELHGYPLTYPTETSTPIFPGSPARRQLSFSKAKEVHNTHELERSISHCGSEIFSTGSSRVQSSTSPAQFDPFYSQGKEVTYGEDFDECWVTVFGFPPSASSYIIDKFSQYGNIIKYEVMSNGNWMHILYQSKLDAKKALSKNGKVFGNGIMVGVQQCIDKTVMDSHSKDEPQLTTVTMRPLNAAYHASTSQNQVLPCDPNIPQKSGSIFSKAMEYMFGW